MDPAPLLKLLSDGTPMAMAGIFLVLFLGAVKKYLDLQKQVFEILRENIEAQNAATAMNEKMLKLLGANGQQ